MGNTPHLVGESKAKLKENVFLQDLDTRGNIIWGKFGSETKFNFIADL